jgi:hypothetical protein
MGIVYDSYKIIKDNWPKIKYHINIFLNKIKKKNKTEEGKPMKDPLPPKKR